MKIWVIIIPVFLGILIPLVWWNILAPVSSGVYPEKHAALVVLEVEENLAMVDFEIPVRWIKSHPWEKVPTLKNITLTDENGKAISTIQGEFRLLVENQWHKRNVSATLEMPINGERIVIENGYVTKPLSDTLQDEYLIEQLDMTYKGHNFIYSMKNTYKLIPTFNLPNLSVDKWRVDASIPVRDADSNTQGYIYELTGPANMVLEEILFWLPGVTEEYFKNKILYSFSGNVDDYMNQSNSFEGQPLSLPLGLKTDVLLLYFPFTEDIVNQISDSIYHVMPTFKVSQGNKEGYYTGIAGSAGPFDRDKSWEDHLIQPE